MLKRSLAPRFVVSAALVAGLMVPSATALAQGAAPSVGPSAEPGQPEDPKIAEARARYERGIKLYKDLAFDAARSEFERAYALVPTYKLLYNIGLVHEQLSDFVGALHKFNQYLKEGGDQISADRRQEVENEIQKLRPRIATLDLTVAEPGSEIYVDDAPVGKSPSPTIELNPGRRKITVSHPGRVTATRVIDVAGSDHAQIKIDLEKPATTTIVVDRPTRRIPWIGWIGTAGLAIGAGVFGYLAIDQNSKLDDAKSTPNADPSALDKRVSRIHAYSITADCLTAAAVIAGAVSLYYTIKWGKETPAPRVGQVVTPRVEPVIGFGTAGLRGTF